MPGSGTIEQINGHAAHMAPKSEQHSDIATDLIFFGIARQETGGYHPGKFLAGVLRLAHSAGITIVLETTVHDIIDLSPVKKSVSTSKRVITAGKVIVATNAYTGQKNVSDYFCGGD